MKYKLVIIFGILFLFSFVSSLSYTSTGDVYSGFRWDDVQNYSFDWNEYQGNLFFTAGNIGIGTTSPQNKLNVVGDGNFTGNLYSNGQLIGSGELNSTGWNKSGTDVFLANSGDNVGIGTSSPNYKIDQQGTGPSLTHNLKINSGAAAGNYGEIAFQTWSGAGSGINTFGGTGTSRPSVVLRGLSEDSSARGSFVVATFNGGADNTALTEKFRITSAGKIGIGTTGPVGKLDINTSNSILSVRDIFSGSYGPQIQTNNDKIVLPHTNYLGDSSAYFGSDGTYGAKLYGDKGTTLMYYDRYGSVGYHPGLYIQSYYNTTVGGAGNVGIGTNSPSKKLEISFSGDTTGLKLTRSDVAGDSKLEFANTLGVKASLGYSSNGYLDLHSGKMIIKDNGDVGIGTTSPQSKLNINGSYSLAGGLTFGDGDSGFYEVADDNFRIAISGVAKYEISSLGIGSNNQGYPWIPLETPTSSNPVFVPWRNDDNTGIGWAASDELSLIAGGVEMARLTTTETTINGDLNVTGAIYGSSGSTIVQGTGTANKLTKWSATGDSIVDSAVTDDSNAVVIEI